MQGFGHDPIAVISPMGIVSKYVAIPLLDAVLSAGVRSMY